LAKREDEKWDYWWGPWKDHIRCRCGALANLNFACPVCHKDFSIRHVEIDGEKVETPAVFPGALTWSHYAMLKMIYGDWARRSLGSHDIEALPLHGESPRALVVLVFWTFFESLMDWFYETSMRQLPPPVREDLLTRYNSIGARMDRLHRVLFCCKYSADLESVGGGAIRFHLEHLQKSRNQFVHGNPEAISDDLVHETVRLFPEFCAVWIRSFNLRCAERQS